MALSQFVAGATLTAADLNTIVDMLQGASGSTDAFLFRSSTGNDFIVRLADAAGARKFIVQDSAGVEVYSVNSDGTVTGGTFTPTTLTLPTSASPSQTTEGQIVWDTDDDRLTVGDGSSRKTFYSGAPTVTLAGSSLAEVATTSTSLVDLITVSGLNIPVTSGVRIVGSYSRTGGAGANVGALGLEINGTAISTPTTTTGIAFTTATNQAEDGIFVVEIAPRVADYLNGWIGFFNSRVSATGAAAVAGQFAVPGTSAAIPNAAITDITITAINNTNNVNIAAANIKVYEVL